MKLILIRHGLPVHRVTDDSTPADPELSETGHEQAMRAAAGLQAIRIDRLYSSPMERALQTAMPLSAGQDLDIEISDGVADCRMTMSARGQKQTSISAIPKSAVSLNATESLAGFGRQDAINTSLASILP